MKNPAVWFEIVVQDMTRARAFYEAVFGVQLTRLDAPNEMWSFPSDMGSYGVSGMLVQAPGRTSGGNSTIIYFACENCAVEAEKVAVAGGKILQPKTSIGQYGQVAVVTDSEGNTIGLHSMK